MVHPKPQQFKLCKLAEKKSTEACKLGHLAAKCKVISFKLVTAVM